MVVVNGYKDSQHVEHIKSIKDDRKNDKKVEVF